MADKAYIALPIWTGKYEENMSSIENNPALLHY